MAETTKHGCELCMLANNHPPYGVLNLGSGSIERESHQRTSMADWAPAGVQNALRCCFSSASGDAELLAAGSTDVSVVGGGGDLGCWRARRETHSPRIPSLGARTQERYCRISCQPLMRELELGVCCSGRPSCVRRCRRYGTPPHLLEPQERLGEV